MFMLEYYAYMPTSAHEEDKQTIGPSLSALPSANLQTSGTLAVCSVYAYTCLPASCPPESPDEFCVSRTLRSSQHAQTRINLALWRSGALALALPVSGLLVLGRTGLAPGALARLALSARLYQTQQEVEIFPMRPRSCDRVSLWHSPAHIRKDSRT
jgi:hypothetical protein